MKMFDKKLVADAVLPFDSFKLFEGKNALQLPDKNSNLAKGIIALGEKCLDYSIPILPLSQYIRFTDDGDRAGYENLYFSRRRALNKLMLAELVENEGRFVPMMMDILYAICEESTWVIPAHNYSIKNHNKPIIAKMPEPVGDNIFAIDLFSAATGAQVALCFYLFRDKFEAAIPELFCNRLRYELNRRIIKPYLNTYDLWWMGYRDSVNNWNPWINVNVLTVTAFAVEDTATRKALAEKCTESIDHYAAGLPNDGGCDEGPNYWGNAGARLLQYAELAYLMTDGKYSVFDNELLDKCTDYIRKVNISDDYFFNCADAHPKSVPCYPFIAHMAKRFGNQRLFSFANDRIPRYIQHMVTDGLKSFCALGDLFDVIYAQHDEKAERYAAAAVEYLPDLQVAALRESDNADKGFYIGIKGGHNAENHNHLDVGNFVLYCDGKPVIIDPGVGTYTRFTFDINYRYKMFAFRTEDHSLPVINGKGQWIEREHHADDFTVDEQNKSVFVQLKNAYVNKDEIKSFVRTAKIDGEKATVCDKIQLCEQGYAEFGMMLYNKPQKLDKNKYRLAENVVVTFSSEFDISVQEIPFDVQSFVKDWGVDRIYKFCIKSPENVTDMELCAEFTHQ